jgi:hypothetical protein
LQVVSRRYITHVDLTSVYRVRKRKVASVRLSTVQIDDAQLLQSREMVDGLKGLWLAHEQIYRSLALTDLYRLLPYLVVSVDSEHCFETASKDHPDMEFATWITHNYPSLDVKHSELAGATSNYDQIALIVYGTGYKPLQEHKEHMKDALDAVNKTQ